jgi:TonB family protein
MSRPIVARATSLAASTGVLALAIAGALSVSYTVQQLIPPDTTPVVSMAPLPVAPPPPVPHTAPPPLQHTIVIPDAPPMPTPLPLDPTPIALSPPAPPGPPTITDPRWLRVPRDLSRYYPARAQQMAVEGSATLECLVAVSGRLNCTIVAETPAGWNFGAAALRISQDYQMAPATQNGQAVQARYRMRVPFQIPQR